MFRPLYHEDTCSLYMIHTKVSRYRSGLKTNKSNSKSIIYLGAF
jgi:hypothetical protein